MQFHTKNFFKNTYCEFKQVAFNFSNVEKYESKSGSRYHYTEEGVYRYSNHWGRVANCRWKLSDVPNYKNQQWYVGYAKWTDFFDLSATERIFFIVVDAASEEVTICIEKNIETSSNFLFSIQQVLLRKKEIQQFFKNQKWLRYTDENPLEIKADVIYQLINSNKRFQEIKKALLHRSL